VEVIPPPPLEVDSPPPPPPLLVVELEAKVEVGCVTSLLQATRVKSADDAKKERSDFMPGRYCSASARCSFVGDSGLRTPPERLAVTSE
jgi:hypothetical protein